MIYYLTTRLSIQNYTYYLNFYEVFGFELKCKNLKNKIKLLDTSNHKSLRKGAFVIINLLLRFL